jgi:anaerobic selenocysteine-containing dehydrogenase
VKLRPPPPRRRLEGYHPPLQVSRFIATHAGDVERGPKVWMRAAEAKVRLLQDGELVWVFGPRRHDLAELAIDETVPRGQLFARDVAGVAPAEIVYVVKPDLDTPKGPERV